VFWYFGYGSNMALRSLRAKGVEPRKSERAVLRGWRLRFNVEHFFRHEGGVGNIEPASDPKAEVWGVLHLCEDEHLVLLDSAEAYPHGYDRVAVSVLTDRGEQRAVAYVGMPAFLNNACRPTPRYLRILLEGAAGARLDPAYIEFLKSHPVHQNPPLPQKFVPPAGEYPSFTAATLAQHALFTALTGFVFDMSAARWHHRFLRDTFGGKDTTLFHLSRLDSSDGSETLDDIKYERLNPAQYRYLNEYLHAYAAEYDYVGWFCY
jgi:sulfite reductase (NADPH) flavoprotein alpha-component